MPILFFIWAFSVFLLGAGTPPVPPGIQDSSSLNLYKGWNLLAPPVNSSFNTREITNIVNQDIFFYDSKKQSWESGYNIRIPPGSGFWVNVSKSSTIPYPSVSSNSFDIKDFVISRGWNLLGMSLEYERVHSISSIHDVKSVYAYDAQKSNWVSYDSYSRSSIYAGMGFWLETN